MSSNVADAPFRRSTKFTFEKRKVAYVPLSRVIAGNRQARGVLVRQWPQEDRIRDAENRGAGADPQGQRGCHDGCESRTLAQRAAGLTEIFGQHGRLLALDILNHQHRREPRVSILANS